MKPMFAVLLIALLFFTILSGCSNNPGNDTADQSGYSYTAEVIPFPELPDGFENVGDITFAGDIVHFTATVNMSSDVETDGLFYSGAIFTMTNVGTNLRKLPEYTVEAPPPAATGGGLYISAMHVDEQGYLWVIETGRYYVYEEPEVTRDAGSTLTIRKLDSNGAELLSTDISDLAVGFNGFYISMFTVDTDGYIYIGFSLIAAAEATIYVLDPDCEVLFNLAALAWNNPFILTPDGSVAFIRQQNNEKYIQKIDVPAKSWGDSIHLPENAINIFPGCNDFLAVFTDNTSLYGLSDESGEVIRLLNWIDTGVTPEGLESITFLQEERIFLIKSTIRPGSGAQINQLIFLTKTESVNAEPNEKTELTLGTLYLNPLFPNTINQFNNTSTTHYITVIDYSSNTTPDDIEGALLRFTTEITAGRVPDILLLTQMPIDRLIALDLLVDLYPFLDADAELSRECLFENVLKANERNGKLYQINQIFNITTIIGNPSVLGEYPGWNMEEFKAVIDANPQADRPFGPNFTKHQFFWMLVYMNLYEYINMDTKTADFNNEDFIDLLKFANTFPSEIDEFINDPLFYREFKAERRQIMEHFSFNLTNFILQRESFGGEIVFKGWPTADRNGSRFISHDSVAITTNAADKEGAWDFIRTLLMEEHQRAYFFGIPINKAAFEEQMQRNMEPFGFMVNGVIIEIEPSQDDVDELVALINSTTKIAGHGSDDRLRNIIIESATDFFNGLISAEDAARIIQNRASIFLAEQE